MIASLACLVAQSAQTDPAVLLRRDVTHVSSHTYYMSYTMTMDMSGVPGAEAIGKQPTTFSVNYREILKPMGGGRAKVSVTMGKMDLKSPMFGGAALPTAKDTSFTMLVDELNRVTFTKGAALTSSAMGASLFGGPTPFGMTSFFPAKPVRYGDTWTMNYSGGGKFMNLGALGKILVTYLGTENEGAIPCYRTQIGVDMDLGALTGAIASQTSGTATSMPTGTFSLTGYTLTSQKDGGIVHSYSSGNGDMNVKAQGQDIKIKIGYSMDLRRTS